MIDRIKQNKFVRGIVLPIYQFINYGAYGPMYKWPQKSLIKANMHYYKHMMGYSFDLNNPILFTEKIQWYKFFYQRSDFANIVDKVLFKDWVSNKLGNGYTIPLYGAWDNIGDFEMAWNDLPQEFVLKANLQSDGRCIKIIHNKSEVNFLELKQELQTWLEIRNTLMNSCDRMFYTSKPQILAEQYMANFEDQLFD